MGQADGAIVERVLAGDRDAFGILIDRHRDGALRLAIRILRARAEAEDVVQEALLHAFLDLAELRDRNRFVAWLLGIVVNLADMEGPTVKRFLAGSSIPRSMLTSEDFLDWPGRLPERAGAWLTMGRLRRRIRLIYADCPGG